MAEAQNTCDQEKPHILIFFFSHATIDTQSIRGAATQKSAVFKTFSKQSRQNFKTLLYY